MESKRKPGRNLIPRPKNCFMTYRMDVQHRILEEKGRINNKDISKIAGQMWNSEPDSVKSFYRQKAEQGKLEHKKLYPNYKYCPKKPKKQNCRKSLVSVAKKSDNCNEQEVSLLQGFDLNQSHINNNEDYNTWIDYINSDFYFPLMTYSSPLAYHPATFPVNSYSTEPQSMDELIHRYVNLDLDQHITYNQNESTHSVPEITLSCDNDLWPMTTSQHYFPLCHPFSVDLSTPPDIKSLSFLDL